MTSMLLEHLLSSSGGGPPLRVALVAGADELPRAWALAVEHVRRSSFARLEAVVRERDAPDRSGAPASPREGRDVSALLFDLYRRWDARRARGESRLVAPVPLDAVAAGVPVREVSTELSGDLRLYGPEALAALRELELDVILRCGAGELGGAALGLARYGIWTLHPYSPADRRRGAPAHFWELARGEPVSRVALELRRRDKPEALVLREGSASTACENSELSWTRNQVRPALLASTFVIRGLKQLHEEGFDALIAAAEAAAPPHVHDRQPSAAELARFLAPRVVRKVRSRWLEPRKVVHWRIAVRVNGAPRYEAGEEFGLDGFRWMDAPPGRLYADPCLVEHGGQVYCFFEDLDHASGIGAISCAVVGADGALEDVRPVLARPYHLSYPFVFSDGGDFFMVPESRKNGTVDLFRAAAFPDRWEHVRTLLHAPGLDTTVLRRDGLYWFFVTVREPPGAGEQLLLLHSESLQGELRLHRRSPVSADIRSCRSAGALFEDRGRLIRPSQDCTLTYGRLLHFHEVLRLTPGEYAERLLNTASPPRGFEGIHTYGRCGNIEVVDGKRMEPAKRHIRSRSGAVDHGQRFRMSTTKP